MIKRMRTYVIFKKLKGEVIAIFPFVKWSDGCVTSYEHIGQHGACDWLLPYELKNARPSEYADLLAEIKRIYDDCVVEVLKKMPRKGIVWARVS